MMHEIGKKKYQTIKPFSDDETVSETTQDEPNAKQSEDFVEDEILDEIDVSASFAANGQGKSVMLSMADVPDISAHDAQQIVQMFADELAETMTGKISRPKIVCVEESHNIIAIL
jgi:hypothetical protein